MLLEIGGCGADHAVVRGDLARDQRGILQLADADGEVEALADDVDEIVGELHIELDVGIAGEEGADIRGDVHAGEDRRHRDLQQAARLGVAAAHEVLGLLAKAEDVDDALEIPCAGLGQRQMPGRALEEPRPQAVLQLADALRHDGGRQPHLTSRRGHVAGAGDACEYLKVADGGHMSPCE